MFSVYFIKKVLAKNINKTPEKQNVTDLQVKKITLISKSEVVLTSVILQLTHPFSL